MQFKFQVSSAIDGGKHLDSESEAFLRQFAQSSDDISAPWRSFDPSDEEILSSIEHYGLCVMPGFFSDCVDDFRHELEFAFRNKPEIYSYIPNKKDVLVLQGQQPPERFKPLYQERFKDLCEKFFKEPFKFNDPTNLHLDHYKNEIPVIDGHFDDRHSLKFLVYLDDTDFYSGALCFALGTHHAIRHYTGYLDALGLKSRHRPNTVRFREEETKTRMRLSWKKRPINGWDKDLPSPIASIDVVFDKRPQIVDVCEAAGTLLIFDTACAHRGGIVSRGRTRRMIRANSRALSEERRHDGTVVRAWGHQHVTKLSAERKRLQELKEKSVISKMFQKLTGATSIK